MDYSHSFFVVSERAKTGHSGSVSIELLVAVR